MSRTSETSRSYQLYFLKPIRKLYRSKVYGAFNEVLESFFSECEASLKAMIEPLEVSCEANLPLGCRYLSLVHWNGEKDREPNAELAEKYMKK